MRAQGAEACPLCGRSQLRNRSRGKKNGGLLNLAENRFDVLVTLDTNLRYQQNLGGRRIAIVVLVAHSSRMDDLIPLFPGCLDAITRIKSGQIIGVGEKLKDSEA